VLVLPEGQAAQDDSDVAPGATEYFPAVQAIHVLAEAAPTVGEYLPTSHAVQVPPLLPWYPALHWHALKEVEDAGDVDCVGQAAHAPAEVAATCEEYVPAMHVLHADAPSESLYLPAGQLEQVPPFGPVKPCLQRQACTDTLPDTALESLGQAVQAVRAVLPVEAAYVSTGQSVHKLSPMLSLYLPATHSKQSPFEP
jgi:hypothetical protein